MRLLIPLIGILFASNVYCQEITELPVVCYDTDKLFKTLKEKYQEVPVIVGLSNDVGGSTLTFWVSKNDTYTVVVSVGEVSCVINTGTELKILQKRGVRI